MKSPVLFLIFLREDTTKKVFETIRQARPPRLYVAADGPRPNRPDDKEKCARTRAIIENVDWPCEVKTLFRESNLGCGKGVSSALTWFFENEEQGIIIEDDIVANPDFFTYCDEMLEKYKDDKRIQLIAGHNCFYNGYKGEYTYYMSNIMHIWGWASWRRVWQTYEFDAAKIDTSTFIKKLDEKIVNPRWRKDTLNAFKMMKNHGCDTWDFQLLFNQILNGRYSIMPYKNLTSNIGFNNADAAHTNGSNNKEDGRIAESPYPLAHPQDFFVDSAADIEDFTQEHPAPSFFSRIKALIRRVLLRN